MRFCWSQLTFAAVILILGISSMLSGCGKKGPLYLPEKATPAATQKPPSEVQAAKPEQAESSITTPPAETE